MTSHRIFVLLLAGMCSLAAAHAQWRLGVTAGADLDCYTQENTYAYDRVLTPGWGGTMGITAQYNFLDWLGLRLDWTMAQRNYTSRFYLREWTDLNGDTQHEQYRYTNTYHLLPLTLSFSFGGEHVRGYADIVGYAGHWTSGKYTAQMQDEYHRQWLEGLQTVGYDTYVVEESYAFDKRRDRRFDAGLVGRIGITYTTPVRLFLALEGVCYYGLVNNHITGSEHYQQPGYHTTAALQIAIGYVFPQK